jgi:hypothetical protein
MKDNQTIAQFLNVKDFPFEIKNKNGKEIYYEDSDGRWSKREYDSKNNLIRLEDSTGFWSKSEYDSDANEIRFKNSNGYWHKCEFDSYGNLIRLEDSSGRIIDKRPKPIIELTLEDVAKLKGVSVDQIRIKE